MARTRTFRLQDYYNIAIHDIAKLIQEPHTIVVNNSCQLFLSTIVVIYSCQLLRSTIPVNNYSVVHLNEFHNLQGERYHRYNCVPIYMGIEKLHRKLVQVLCSLLIALQNDQRLP